MEAKHDSVLLEESIEALSIEPNDIVVDGTVGGAGHWRGLFAALSSEGVLVGIDADQHALERAREVLDEDPRTDRPMVHLIADNFRNLARILERLGISHINKALFDLGWSGYQLAEGRGFSFREDEPLLMTYSDSGSTGSAAELLATASEEELSDILHTYGEERFARGIARAIVLARAKERIVTTNALVKAVEAGTPAWYHHRKTHPATKTFQALRIAVNDELGAIREGLAATIDHLSPGGRVAVITFHSIEDRIVKNIFREAHAKGSGLVVNKKVIVPSVEETKRNPRSRSAKLRVFERSIVAASLPDTSSSIAYA
ncbi:MAG: 16S rRNA (cytosine(1402)-N(4))-methyltransferase RsmH [Minisyncoccia bacterium]